MLKLDFGKLKVNSTYIVASPLLVTNFSNTRSIQISRMKSNPKQFLSTKWKNSDPQTFREQTINIFKERAARFSWNANCEIEDGYILPMVHGTTQGVAWKIAAAGFASLSTLDEGFYGKGIYFSSSAMYTLPYFSTEDPAILICLASPGNPYPVIEHQKAHNSIKGKPIMIGYQSHYVVTRKDGSVFFWE